MKKHYSDYVSHCLRFYARHPKPNYFKSEVDRKDWQAVDTALKGFSEEDREILLTVYREGDTMTDNVYQTAKKHHINQDRIWNMIENLEKKCAKKERAYMNHYENIPEEIKTLGQWVCTRNDSKVPMKAFENEAASSTNPTTWSDFSVALDAVEKGYYDYCGFVFNDNGLVGIDIDVGYEDGLMSPLAADIIGRCESYTEKSKSGRGFHILLRGTLPFKGKNNLAGVEIYKAARYFIMTGDILLYPEIVENQEAIDYVVEKYFPDVRDESSSKEYTGRIYSPMWKEPPENGRFKLRPVYPRIPDGSRNICLTSLAGLLHNQGYNKAQIYEELLYANAVACDPPLGTGEIQTICNSVTRYKR